MNDEKKDYLSQYTRKELLANWFYYNKWWLLLGILLALSLFQLIRQNITRIRPDYRFAYVGSRILPGDTLRALEDALAEYGSDINGDGRVVVQFNQYPTAGIDEDGALDQTAWETKLMADLLKGESYFFLLDDPDAFQHTHQLLAELDGSVPKNTSRSGLDKVYRVADCPVLSSLELGAYQDVIAGQKVSGQNMSLIENLYFGRRFFLKEAGVTEPEGCAALWDTLTEGAVKGAIK